MEPAATSRLRLLFGRAFLVALERHPERAIVFARALLTQFPAVQPR